MPSKSKCAHTLDASSKAVLGAANGITAHSSNSAGGHPESVRETVVSRHLLGASQAPSGDRLTLWDRSGSFVKVPLVAVHANGVLLLALGVVCDRSKGDV